jgi:hypothetical protein
VPGFLVNAAHVQQGPGRQTAKADARWLATRRRHGLRQASGIPAREPRDWRDLRRDRPRLVQERRREGKRVPGVLERATLKLAAVAPDIMGVSAAPSWPPWSRDGRTRPPWRSWPNGGGGARCRGWSRR